MSTTKPVKDALNQLLKLSSFLQNLPLEWQEEQQQLAVRTSTLTFSRKVMKVGSYASLVLGGLTLYQAIFNPNSHDINWRAQSTFVGVLFITCFAILWNILKTYSSTMQVLNRLLDLEREFIQDPSVSPQEEKYCWENGTIGLANVLCKLIVLSAKTVPIIFGLAGIVLKDFPGNLFLFTENTLRSHGAWLLTYAILPVNVLMWHLLCNTIAFFCVELLLSLTYFRLALQHLVRYVNSQNEGNKL
ncbi:unnamed protein product [Orchesella dallaii]|uniref:Transmembrane protein n=1 Tax=Orchesella dallaii TaxID=48710 RepID=A0ABP1QZ29_9HEXA